jgi:hypothetical protein
VREKVAWAAERAGAQRADIMIEAVNSFENGGSSDHSPAD